MMLFIRSQRFCLWNKIPFVLAVIISPAVYLRNLSGPVSVAWSDWCCPFKCVSSPGIGRSNSPAFKYGIKKVEYKHKLHGKYHHRNIGNELVQCAELPERGPTAVIHVTTRHTCETFIMHWPKDQVSTCQRN